MSAQDDLSDLLPKLQPPAGGLARLRKAVGTDSRIRYAWQAPALMLAAAAALFVSVRQSAPARSLLANDPVIAALALESRGASLEVRDPQRMAASRVSTSEAVVYYRVEGVTAGRTAPDEGHPPIGR